MNLKITRLTADRIPAAMKLVEVAGWNQTANDWQRVIEYQPDGCFCALNSQLVNDRLVNDQLVGTVTSTSYGQDLAWIGMMLVHPDARRQGIGMQLMQRAVEMLKDRPTRVIGLDATPAGKPLYERLGFQAAFDFQRWQRPETNSHSTPIDDHVALDERQDLLHNFSSCRTLDLEAFGVDRRQWLMRVARNSRSVRCDQHGFAMLRSGRIADYLGPVMYDSPTFALPAIEALVASSSRSIIWDIIQPTSSVLELAHRLGFQPIRALSRMFLGGVQLRVNLDLQYAICDPASA